MTFRIGLLVPQYGGTMAEVLETATEADRNGLDVWVAGQMFAISERWKQSAFEPLTLMAAIAARTRRARLGFMVLAAPYLPPLYLAKALVTLDHIAGGRLEIGLGAGWRREEFEALGIPFESGPDRIGSLERALDLVSAHAEGGAAAEARELPGPASVQRPRPPVWIAGRGKRILELAGRRADWTNFARGISVEDFIVARDVMRESLAAADRDEEAVRLSLTGTFLIGSNDDVESMLRRRAGVRGVDVDAYRQSLLAANALVGTPAEAAAQLEPYIEAGCEAAILWPLDGNHTAAAVALGELSETISR